MVLEFNSAYSYTIIIKELEIIEKKVIHMWLLRNSKSLTVLIMATNGDERVLYCNVYVSVLTAYSLLQFAYDLNS